MASRRGLWAVTVNWNRGEDTVECLRSLLDCGVEALVVVDNGSTDDSVSLISREVPGARLLEMGENLGYVKGMNAGLVKAMEEGAELLLLINNDAVAGPGMTDLLLQGMRGHPQAGIAGPTILYHSDEKVWFAGGQLNRTWGYSTHPFMDEPPPEGQKSRMVDFITGCVMMVRREVLEEVGLLDPRYFMYMEDLDLCLRARRSGYQCWYIPEAIAYHKVSSSSGVGGSNIMTPLRSYYYARNMLLLVHRMGSESGAMTRYLGQFLVRLPYYAFLISSQRVKGGLTAYLRGLNDGMISILGGEIDRWQ